MAEAPAPPSRWRHWRTAIARGARCRCPRCGRSPLFERWNRVRDNCDSCGLRYLLNQGDPWVFLLVLDRGVFILPPIAVIYFGLLPESVLGIVVVFGLLAAGIIYTTPHRYGVCIALDWLTRTDDDGGAIRYPSPPSADSDSAPTPREPDRGQRPRHTPTAGR